MLKMICWNNTNPYLNKEVDGGPAVTKHRIEKLYTLSYAKFDIKQKTSMTFCLLLKINVMELIYFLLSWKPALIFLFKKCPSVLASNYTTFFSYNQLCVTNGLRDSNTFQIKNI